MTEFQPPRLRNQHKNLAAWPPETTCYQVCKLTDSAQPFSEKQFGHNSLVTAWRTLIQEQQANFRKKVKEEPTELKQEKEHSTMQKLTAAKCLL